MPVVYLYALSDFVSSIPNEQGARAAGSPPFVITTGPTLTRITVEVTDNDPGFDEIDATQTLTNDLTLDGQTYSAGDRIFGNYILTDAGGLEIYSVTIGTNNSGNNTTTAVASLTKLEPNTTYTFISESNYNRNQRAYGEFVCFTSGALVECPREVKPVEALKVGDGVVTRDNGVQTIRWIGQRSFPRATMRLKASLRPVVIPKDAFGEGRPSKDLALSPQHRVLVARREAELLFAEGKAELLFAEGEVLAPAKGLLGQLARQSPAADVTHHHFAFDEHQVVRTNRIWTESLLPGESARDTLDDAQRAELAEVFPDLSRRDAVDPTPARPLISVTEGKVLAGMIGRRSSAAAPPPPPQAV